MDPALPEWKGKVPPGAPAYIGPTTTMSLREFNMWLSRQPRMTTQPSSWGEDAMPFLPLIIGSIFLTGICTALFLCSRFGGDTWDNFSKTVFGSRRFMTLYQTEIVHIHQPEDKARVFEELPPRITREDILRMEANDAAIQALQDACKNAFRCGRIHLVSMHFSTGPGPQQEAVDVERAVADVRAKGLQNEGDNARLIEEGVAWTTLLHNETRIVSACQRAFPLLEVDYQNLSRSPVPGAPWAGTVIGHQIDNEKRRDIWRQVEELTQAIKMSSTGGASQGLIDEANKLIANVIARTPELPADRCILDPEGHGVKLLPKGRQRAIWQHTGEAYLYDPDSNEAGAELNNFDLPPKQELRNTSVDAARPVCATFAKGQKCHLGKRCPWRHTKPVAGDSVREPVGFA
jgi:hypothetical protein